MKKVNLKEINSQLPNLRTLYNILVDNKGYFLPSFESHACTSKYLMRVIKDERVFRVLRNNITEPGIIKQNKTVNELFDIISRILKDKNLDLGFDEDYHPDKDWLIKVLYHLEPKNPIFLFEEETITREIPEK